MKNRIQALSDLVNLTKPIEEVRNELSEFEWESEEELYSLTRERIRTVLERALKNEFPLEHLVLWADSLEMREDLAYEKGHEGDIAQILFLLSAPEINHPITEELVHRLLNDLNQKAEPGELVNASAAAGLSENHLHD